VTAVKLDEMTMNEHVPELLNRTAKNMESVATKMEEAAQIAHNLAETAEKRKQLEAELGRLNEQLSDLSTPDAALAMTKRDREAAIKRLTADYIDILLELHSEVKLSVVNGEGCALLGADVKNGVAYYMKIGRRAPGESKAHAGRRAALQAYTMLLNKLGKRPVELPYIWQ
jgi:hypothetical protein